MAVLQWPLFYRLTFTLHRRMEDFSLPVDFFTCTDSGLAEPLTAEPQRVATSCGSSINHNAFQNSLLSLANVPVERLRHCRSLTRAVKENAMVVAILTTRVLKVGSPPSGVATSNDDHVIAHGPSGIRKRKEASGKN